MLLFEYCSTIYREIYFEGKLLAVQRHTGRAFTRPALTGALLKELTFEELFFKFVFLHQLHHVQLVHYDRPTTHYNYDVRTM